MNIVDVAIVIIFVIYFYDGFRRGFIRVGAELILAVMAILLSLLTMRGLGTALGSLFNVPENYQSAVGFMISWLIFQSSFSVLYAILIKKVAIFVDHHIVNKLSGMFLSFGKSLVGVLIFLALVTAIPSPMPALEYFHDSWFNRVSDHYQQPIREKFTTIISRDLIPSSTLLVTPQPEIGEKLDLGFRVHDFEYDAQAEAEMLSLLNKERVTYGLQPLEVNQRALEVARKHSADMLSNGYFSHTAQDGRSPFERMDDGGVIYDVGGENLAFAPSVVLAHRGLMDSPGHRKNILSPDYKKVGIGVANAGKYGMMFTQNFTD